MEIRRKVAERLLHLRATRTKAALARDLGVDRWTVDRLEQLEAPITVELVEKVAHAVGEPAIEFLCRGQDPIWPTVDLQRRIEAIQQHALDELESEVGRFRDRLGEDYLAAIQRLSRNAAHELQDLESRLTLLRTETRRDVMLSLLNRELADQARESRAARTMKEGS